MLTHIHPVFDRLLSEFTANVRTVTPTPDPLEDYAQHETSEQRRRECVGFESSEAPVVWIATWVESLRTWL